MAIEWVEADDAKARSGVRLVTVGGIPSPWSEAAKGILHVKQIPFVAVRMSPGDNAVTRWTQRSSAPVLFFDEEAPRDGWAEILLLAERIAPEPALIPAGAEARAEFFGLAHEICGEMGLGWCQRLAGVAASIDSEGAVGFAKPVAEYLGRKYGYRPGCGDEMRSRVIALLGMLSKRLHAQRDAGSGYYLADSLTALDIYSATFMGILSPLDPERCVLPEMLRKAFESRDPETQKALDPILLEHRDRIYSQYLELPVEL